MVALPVAGLAFLGLRLVRDEERLVSHQISELLESRLREVDDAVVRFMDGAALERRRFAARLPQSPDDIRAAIRADPAVGHVLVTDRKGKVLFPPLGAPSSQAERDFLLRTKTVWEGRALPALARDQEHGWYGWYHDEGLNLLCWVREPGRIIAVEMARIDLLSELVAVLPSTHEKEGAGGEGRTALLDSAGAVVYQWGTHQPVEGTLPTVSVALSAPLGAWRLVHWPRVRLSGASGPTSRTFVVVAGVGAFALAMLVIAAFLYRERTREMRLAAQRVTFVGQVSHELRTPLTNIRLYAELAESEIDPDEEERLARYLAVIGAESQRLGRLIENVLSYARTEQGRLRLRVETGCVDEVLDNVLASFEASLESAGIEVDYRPGAPAAVRLDADVLEQIVANLVSNVEKYASKGGWLSIRSSREGEVTRVIVADRGPGIASEHRDRVFEPYYRISDKLSDGVAGTGIGLDIARRLARLHGGDLRLVVPDSDRAGAVFELTVLTPDAEEIA